MLDNYMLQADLECHLGSLYPAMTKVERIATDYLLAKLQTKIIPESSEDIDKTTLEKFTACNNRCKEFLPRLEDARFLTSEILDIAKGELHRLFDEEPCTLEALLWEADLGPGANVKSHPSCSYPLKIGLRLSGTERALRCVRAGVALYDLRLGESAKDLAVLGSNITFVPKTTRSSRMIATEPTANMLLQKGVDAILRRGLLRYGIDMATQPEVNRELARLGSIDGSYATIDLSSASDLLSIDLVKLLLPARLYQWIEVSRSSQTYHPSTGFFNVYCATTAGNGYCSSLQTLVFAALCHAAGVPKPAVFGDDIIVPTQFFGRVIRVLVDLGFSPNMEKTFDVTLPNPFGDGHFRESCGHDYLNGVNIRPVFVKTMTDVDAVIVYNQVLAWFERFSFPFPFAPCCAPFKSGAGLVPPHYPEDSGYRSVDYARYLKKGRIKVIEVDGSTSYVNGSWFRVFSALKEQLSISQLVSDEGAVTNSFRGPSSLVKAISSLSEEQLLVSVLRGSIRAGRLTVRPQSVVYEIKLVFDALPEAWSKWLPGV